MAARFSRPSLPIARELPIASGSFRLEWESMSLFRAACCRNSWLHDNRREWSARETPVKTSLFLRVLMRFKTRLQCRLSAPPVSNRSLWQAAAGVGLLYPSVFLRKVTQTIASELPPPGSCCLQSNTLPQ